MTTCKSIKQKYLYSKCQQYVQVSGQPVSNQGDRSSYNKTGLIKINFMRPVLKNAYFLGLVSKT